MGAANVEVVEEIVVGVQPDTVWEALVDADRRRGWWSYLELDPVIGGDLTERWTDDDGKQMVTSGVVLELAAPRLLRLCWADEDWPAPTEVEIALSPLDEGTVVRVRHGGWEHVPDGDRLADAHRVGWRTHLRNLRDHVEGAQPHG